MNKTLLSGAAALALFAATTVSPPAAQAVGTVHVPTFTS